MLAAGRFRPRSLLVLENRVAGMAATLALLPADTPVYVVSAAVMDTVAGFPMHRGILAIGERGTLPSPAELLQTLPPRATVVVPVGIANHDNVGAIFRNAAAFGADAVILDATSCDPLYRKAIRVSVGAALRVPYAVAASVEELLPTLAACGFSIVGLSPSGETRIEDYQRGERLALLLGTEGKGLPAELMARIDTVRIAMAPGFDSLNVAAASAVALHRLE